MSSFLLRRFYSLSGVFSLGLFLFCYLYSNAKAFGPNGVQNFNDYQKWLTGIPFLPVFEFVFVFVPLVFHVFYSCLVFYRGQGNFWQYPNAGNLRYTLHRITGILGFLFLIYHFFFDPILSGPADYLSRVHLFETPDGVLVTLIGGTALFYYFSSNVWNALISWGMTASPSAQARSWRACLVLFFLMALLNFLIVANAMYHYEAPPGWIGVLLKLAKGALFR